MAVSSKPHLQEIKCKIVLQASGMFADTAEDVLTVLTAAAKEFF